MTEQEIEHEVLQPSTYWIEAGNGSLGKIYLEIIGCDKLPNMDVGNVSLKLPHKDKTDAFACIVYEDVIVNTDLHTIKKQVLILHQQYLHLSKNC